MKNKLKKIGLVATVLMFAGGSFLGWAKYKTAPIKGIAKPVVMDSVQSNKIDTVKVERLKRVYGKLNLNKNEFLIAGSISAKNGADTADRLNNAAYIFSRKGASFYFKLGTTETINANGIYLYIDHKIKRVLLAKKKEVISDFIMPELTTILNTVNEEGFELSSTTNGEIEQITLLNPYHLSCKEYTIAFNKKTLKPNKLYVRLSNSMESEDVKKDNVIDFRIRLSSPVSAIETYTVQNIVKKEKRGWILYPGFKSYELINTL